MNWGEKALTTDRPGRPVTVVGDRKLDAQTTYREDFKKATAEEERLNELSKTTMININKVRKA